MLTRLTVALLACTASATVLADEDAANQAFIRQQESFSHQLRQQDNAPLRQMLEQQVRQNPLSDDDTRFIGELKKKQQGANQEKPDYGALYFVSFSIPPSGLKRMLAEARTFSIPATLRGMVKNDMATTANAVTALVKDGTTTGISIDPTRFRKFSISSVPTLVVYCASGHDVVRGNIHLKQALKKVVEKGECREQAQQLLQAGESK